MGLPEASGHFRPHCGPILRYTQRVQSSKTDLTKRQPMDCIQSVTEHGFTIWTHQRLDDQHEPDYWSSVPHQLLEHQRRGWSILGICKKFQPCIHTKNISGAQDWNKKKIFKHLCMRGQPKHNLLKTTSKPQL